MVVGNGMLARAFSHYAQDDDILIFASGVSNSQQRLAEEFEREKNLLANYTDARARLIYFSTVSIYDSSLLHSPYIIHKKEIEDFISESYNRFTIFRLPILLGRSDNPNTLANFIYNKVISGEIIPVHTKACRYLMDLDDVSRIITLMLKERSFENQCINACFDNRIKVSELISMYEKILAKEARRELYEDGSCYSVPNQIFLGWLADNPIEIQKDYNLNLIRKYFG